MKFIKNIIKTAAVAVAVCAMASCDDDVFNINSDPFRDQTYTSGTNSPIASFMAENTEFSEYAGVLQYSGMFNALNQCSAGVSFTAFAPTNEAMRNFCRRRGIDSVQHLGKDYAKAFVLYHTVKDSIQTAQFVVKDFLTNLDGDRINISIDPVNPGQATLNGEGQVVEMGVPAYNGLIYVLSEAMTPLVETVYDRLAEAGNCSLMLKAIDEAGWTKKLRTVSDTAIVTNEAGIKEKVVTNYYYTLFAVTDQSFADKGIASVEQLKSTLAADDKKGVGADSLLREFVGYHIMTNAYTTDQLAVTTGATSTRIWGTAAKNQVMTITVDPDKTGADRITLNESGQMAAIGTNSDVKAKNGYMHTVSAWLPVWEPEQQEVVWDFADNTDIKNIVPADIYQPAEPTSSENKVRIATAKCFEFEQGPSGSSNRTYNEIDYVTCKSNLKDAMNNDRVVLNLGYMGHVKMTTPTIIKGKYRVELTIAYTTANSFMRQQTDGNGGMIKTMFDGNEATTCYATPYTQVTSVLPGMFTSTLYDEVDFDETATHTFDITVLDPAASTNTSFCLQLDYIRFVPIK